VWATLKWKSLIEGKNIFPMGLWSVPQKTKCRKNLRSRNFKLGFCCRPEKSTDVSTKSNIFGFVQIQDQGAENNAPQPENQVQSCPETEWLGMGMVDLN
jgi:hypothetical protein